MSPWGCFQIAPHPHLAMVFPSWASKLIKVKMSCYSLLLLFSLISPRYVTATVHDDSFIPDAILRVTAQTVSVGGIQRLATLINGTIPGPELRVPENEVAWIRVFNDISDQNLTMVSRMIIQMVPSSWSWLKKHPALAWTRNGCVSFLRRNTTCQSMADTSQLFL